MAILCVMQLPAAWIGIDVVGSQLRGGKILVHSANGKPVGRALGRAAGQIGFDREGEKAFTAWAQGLLKAGPTDDFSHAGKIHSAGHWVATPDGTSVGLIAWLSDVAPGPRPVYNCWQIDFENLTSRSGGDNLEMLGDGRKPGELRSIRDLLRWVNPDDTPGLLALHYDAVTAQETMVARAYWSIRPPSAPDWIHLWSAATITADSDRRRVHGLTVQLSHRDEFDTHTSDFARYIDATVLLTDALTQVTLTASGELADVVEQNLDALLSQLDIARVAQADRSGMVIEQTVTVGGRDCRAAVFRLPSAQHTTSTSAPTAILLVPIQ